MPRDLTAICAVLTEYLPDGDRITGVRALTAGNSNETYLVEGLDLVLRLPPSEAPLLERNRVHDVVGQYRIFEEMAARHEKLPVPAVVRLEADPAVLGDQFFLMERVPGEPWSEFSAPAWTASAAESVRAAVCEQLVDAYAELHREPLDALGPAYSTREEVERWYAPVVELAGSDLREAFELLIASAPVDAAPAACHGDSKLANTLWHEGRLTALLDVEMAFNGDPRWDVANLAGMFGQPGSRGMPGMDAPGFWSGQRLVSEWSARTGRAAGDLEWFQAAARARYAAIVTYGAWLFEQGQSTDARFGEYAAVLPRMTTAALNLVRRHCAAG
ncbi:MULTISPECIES: phosphotransferase family protein [Parafrankia]|uniref:phosphotransferase family protein n=1 Tax=Parafrankia TaxID=2994362 RepID=UPI0013F4D52D|nr:MULTISPECIES: phosphotransferase family protein [Parafrankia]MBE3199680.1 phosphotransferase family protein [Parafrankia sp. CH37]